MSKYLINDKVSVWDMGELIQGTVHSAHRTMFGNIKYTIAIKIEAGFDPDGIGKQRYKYLKFSEEDVIEKIG